MDRTLAEAPPVLPHPHPAVMFREVSDGAVLLQMEDEIYFGLNEVGARVWQLLPPISASLEALCASMATIYPDVPVDQLAADIAELIDQLRDNKLLVDAPAGEA